MKLGHRQAFANLNFEELEQVTDLPGRETHLKSLLKFLNLSHCGGILFLSGVPGTGKTATAKLALKHVQKKSPQTQIIFVNGMETLRPITLFQSIYGQVYKNSRILNPQACISELDKYFRLASNRRSQQPKARWVIVVDEIDFLMTKGQKLLYTIFDWACSNPEELRLIAISNTMNLPELLLLRNASRIGIEKLDFFPYTTPQIITILEHRMGRYAKEFSKEALEFCARKVAEYSGDIRRGFHICRKALLTCKTPIKILDIKQIEANFHTSAFAQAIQCLPFLAKLLLTCVIITLRNTVQPSQSQSLSSLPVMPIFVRFETVSLKYTYNYKISAPVVGHFFEMLQRLHLIVLKRSVPKLEALLETKGSSDTTSELVNPADQNEYFGGLSLIVVAEVDEIVSGLHQDPVCLKELS